MIIWNYLPKLCLIIILFSFNFSSSDVQNKLWLSSSLHTAYANILLEFTGSNASECPLHRASGKMKTCQPSSGASKNTIRHYYRKKNPESVLLMLWRSFRLLAVHSINRAHIIFLVFVWKHKRSGSVLQSSILVLSTNICSQHMQVKTQILYKDLQRWYTVFAGILS